MATQPRAGCRLGGEKPSRSWTSGTNSKPMWVSGGGLVVAHVVGEDCIGPDNPPSVVGVQDAEKARGALVDAVEDIGEDGSGRLGIIGRAGWPNPGWPSGDFVGNVRRDLIGNCSAVRERRVRPRTGTVCPSVATVACPIRRSRYGSIVARRRVTSTCVGRPGQGHSPCWRLVARSRATLAPGGRRPRTLDWRLWAPRSPSRRPRSPLRTFTRIVSAWLLSPRPILWIPRIVTGGFRKLSQKWSDWVERFGSHFHDRA